MENEDTEGQSYIFKYGAQSPSQNTHMLMRATKNQNLQKYKKPLNNKF